jgi:YggT family protein
MLQQILSLILVTVAGLLGNVLLLRMYLAWLRVSRTNPLAIFCLALSDWLVGPLRRILPMRGRFDVPTLVACLIVASAYVFLMGLIAMGGFWAWSLFVPGVLLVLLRWALYLLILLIVGNAILSFVNPHAPLAPTFDVLTRPFLALLRRIIPPLGGFDLSPMVAILVLYILWIVLNQFGLSFGL